VTGLAGLRADHVALRVPDYESVVRFYVEQLRFVVDREWSQDDLPGLRLCYLRLGGFCLEVIGGGRPEPQASVDEVPDHLRSVGLVHVCLHVDDLDAAVAALRDKGVELFAEPFELPQARRRLAFVRDPAGTLVELAEDLHAA
jgi:catechol 2,3-dioxygenase-like lactoylglutathione lyase family enzyme